MKTYQNLTMMTVLAWAVAQTPCAVLAAPAEVPPAGEAAPQPAPETAPAKTSPHLKLCEMLGLRVGATYEFMIAGNDDVHYWTIRSLGAKGWILVQDSRYPATWLNLKRVIAVTPINFRSTPERPKKPNRQ